MTIVLPIKYKEYRVLYSKHFDKPYIIDENDINKTDRSFINTVVIDAEKSPRVKKYNSRQLVINVNKKEV